MGYGKGADASAEDVRVAASILANLQPGFLPLDIFLQIARLVVLTIVEVVPLRLDANGEVEVLLIERPQDDPYWAGRWHTPGTVVLADEGEAGFDKALERIKIKELDGAEATAAVFVEHRLHRSRRGMENASVYWAEVTSPSAVGQFFPLAKLPPNTIESQFEFIESAAKHFLRHKRAASD